MVKSIYVMGVLEEEVVEMDLLLKILVVMTCALSGIMTMQVMGLEEDDLSTVDI